MEMQEMNLLKTFPQALAQQPWRQVDISGVGHSLSKLMSRLEWAPHSYGNGLYWSSQEH